MKVLLVAGFFPPEITPRAMRVWELAREFSRRGHDVTVVVPNREIYRSNDHGAVEVVYGDGPLQMGGDVPLRKRARRWFPEFLVPALFYLYNHEFFMKYDKGIEKALVSLHGDFDLLVSFSYPVAVHRAVMKAMSKNPRLRARVKLAEFSDPPMRGEHNRRFFPLYHRFLSRMGCFYDSFVIPVENARECYVRYKAAEDINIIPQAFDNSGITPAPYLPNDIPVFAFAGRFYRNTRDPEPLFRYLAGSGRDFRFELYLLDRDPYFMDMIDRYNAVARGRIVVKDPLPRRELIRELGRMDFLVNHNFNYTTATPSKLIDYALTGRPVYSFSSDSFDPQMLDRFLSGDYSAQEELPDPENHRIAAVAAKFEGLFARYSCKNS